MKYRSYRSGLRRAAGSGLAMTGLGRRRLRYRQGFQGDTIRKINGVDGALKERTAELRQALAFNEGIVNAIPDLLSEIGRDGEYLGFWSGHADLAEAARKNLLGKNIRDILPPDSMQTALLILDEVNRNGFSTGNIYRTDFSGEGERWYEVSASRKEPHGTCLVLSRNVTERKQQQDLLSKREQEFRALLENSPDTIARFDRECRRTYVNPAFERLYGQPAEKVLGKTPSKSTPIPDALSQTFEKRLREVLRTGMEFTLETPVIDAAGNQGFGHVRIVPEFNMAGEVTSVLVVGRDITRHKENEIEQRRLNRALRMLSGCNKLLIHADDEDRLLKDICRLTVDTGEHKIAWVGYRQNDEFGTINLKAHFGLPQGYTPRLKVSWKENDWGWGMVGNAIRSGSSVINRDYETNPALASWRAETRQLGITTGISLPLKKGADVFGVLNIYSGEAEAFGKEEIQLLEELAGNLAFGIVMLRLRRERIRMEAQLRSQEQAFRALAENSPDTIARYDRECRRLYTNQAFSRLTGISVDALLGQNPSDYNPFPEASAYELMLKEVFASGEMGEIEYTWPDAQGNQITSHICIVPEFDETGEVVSVLATGRDITKQREAHLEIEHLARHDILTGLPNRQTFQDRANYVIAAARRSGKKAALLFVDLDNFKTVNDSLGHAVGDKLLQEVSQRFLSCVRETDSVGRQGGDEFVITLCDVEQVSGVLQVVSRLFQELEQPICLAGNSLSVSMSIGVALYPDDGDSFDELLKKADAAMYQAKNAGRNTFRFVSGQTHCALPEFRRGQADCGESLYPCS